MQNLNSGSNVFIKKNWYKVIIDKFTLMMKIKNIANRIKNDYTDTDPPILLFVTNGGMYLGVDLSRFLTDLGFTHYIATIMLSRYKGDSQTGKIEMTQLTKVISNRHVIIIEDLIDRGATLNRLHQYLLEQNPLSIEYCVLVIKKEHEPLNFNVKYYILKESNLGWLVGYGMDTYEDLRGLEFICQKIE